VKYVLDTHLYIEATRSAARNRELVAFFTRHTPRIWLHSVVAAELLAGAVAVGVEARTRRSFLEPLEAVDRVVTPSHASWKRAGAVLAALVREGVVSPGGFGRSFFNDCVIAASAREHGFVLVTSNARDFQRIASLEPLSYTPPWPD
jgi:predicted nucleic acid-binding protein